MACDTFAFRDGENTIHRGQRDLLLCPAGPVNFNFVDLRDGSEPEVKALIRTGSVASAAENVCPLSNPAYGQEHFGADLVARALWCYGQLLSQPGIDVLE